MLKCYIFYLKEVSCLWKNRSLFGNSFHLFQLMRKNKQGVNPEQLNEGKFLTKHQSMSTLPFFCCGTSIPVEPDPPLPRLDRSHCNKMSVKNLMNKSAIMANKSTRSFTQSQLNLMDKKSNNFSAMYSHSRNPSGLSNFNQSESGNPGSGLNKQGKKIQFSYKQGRSEGENSINNYHTTNYIVDKYIVQPQEMNIIVSNRLPQQKQRIYSYDYRPPSTGRYFDLSSQFDEESIQGESPQWAKEETPYHNSPFPPRSSYQKQEASNNCHFSFGKQQRHQFMSKYFNSGLKEVESRRQSHNSKESKYRSSCEPDGNKFDEGSLKPQPENYFLENQFKKTSLLHFVREHDNAIDSEDFESEEEGSEVIEDHQAMVKRLSESPQHRISD